MADTINSKTLDKLNAEREKKYKHIKQNTAYVKGRNPVTLNEAPQKKPDNRITIPLAKIAVDTVHGYSGRAGDIKLYYEPVKVSEDDEKKEDAFIDAQKEIAEHNEEPIETSELYHDALTYGYAYELLWISDELSDKGLLLTPEYKRIPPGEIVLKWSRDLKPVLEYAVRYQKYDDEITVDVYYPLYSQRWRKKQDSDFWERDTDYDTKYPYTDVPVVIYKLNPDEESLFEAEKGLIDANDKILNKTVNEIDRFNALIALMPGKISKEIADKLTEVGVIDDLDQFENRWPEYLQKDLSGINDLYTGAAKWIKELFFQSVSVPDFSDKDFLNAASGIAMAYKLIGLEFLASKIDTYFIRGLKERYKLINDVLKTSSAYNPDDYKVVVETHRNLPVDKLTAAEIAIKLMGIVSKETLLRMLPKEIIDDVDAELKKLEEEAANTVDLDVPSLTVDEE